MRITPIHLHKNKMMTNYRAHDAHLLTYFDNAPFTSLTKRYAYLQKQSYDRATLTTVLKECNENWGASRKTLEEIERLNHPSSVVVIGGQQAGLLTGPLYSLNKVISIIQYAKQQEKILGVSVIPVFWIAGEDHDYDEINHAYYLQAKKMVKHTLNQKMYEKQSLSHMKMEKDIVTHWYKEIMQSISETSYTKQLDEIIMDCIQQANTFVDFFAMLIHQLFPQEGIVLIDSGDTKVRKLESPMFEQLIHRQALIAKAAYDAKTQLAEDGYDIDLDLAEDDAHLFYHDHHNERILLRRDHTSWVGKNDEVHLETKELIKLAHHSPERLSNNVVTRPLMQEYLFPVLAFIAGDGEIGYWATLKNAFHTVNMEMPPVVPRLSFTYVTNKMEKQLLRRQLHIKDVMTNGTTEKRDVWIKSQSKPTINEIVNEARVQMRTAHEPIQAWAEAFRDDMAGLAKKNLQLIERELTYMEERMKEALKEKHAFGWNEYLLLEQYFFPKAGLQERVWNPLPFINEYGIDWINDLLNNECSFENNHYIIYL